MTNQEIIDAYAARQMTIRELAGAQTSHRIKEWEGRLWQLELCMN